MTDETKRIILNAKKEDMPVPIIAKIIKFSKSAIHRFLSKEHHNV